MRHLVAGLSDALHRLTVALADRYTVDRELGAGGMATVYLAHDVRHDRDVAIKVLHEDLGATLGPERFLAEIKTTAKLQHPHILPLLDSGEVNGLLFYVMPYVVGETLRDRLTRETQLPIDDAVRIAREVADALGYAHGHGIIHRDIKPENILLQGGHAVVADFGIALAVQHAGGSRLTQTGLSLGTPQYMAPEQAMGEKTVDHHADIYALGAVTYEMLTGEPPFTGATVQAIVAKVLSSEPELLTRTRNTIPAHVEGAVLQALAKLPADRFASASAFSDALVDHQYTGAARYASTRTTTSHAIVSSQRRRNALLLLSVLVCIVVLVRWLRPTATPGTSRQRVTLWQHSLGRNLAPGNEREATQIAIAPDGSSIVFADSMGGTLQLFRKLRTESKAIPIAGTEGGLSPCFSPDGKWIGYVTIDGKLRKVPVGGGGSITLSDSVSRVYSATAWLDDGTIVFVGRLGLSRVSDSGGASRLVEIDTTNRGINALTISPLPGSRGIVYTVCPGNCSTESSVYVLDFAAHSTRLLVANAAGAWYSPTGHLLYTDRAGGLYATGFDAKRLAVTSASVPVIDDVMPTTFAISASGSVLYTVAAGGSSNPSELMWVSRDGTAVPLDSTWRADFEYPALSPDGKTLAVSVTERTTQLWIRRSDGRRHNLTQDGTVNWRPAWTIDGRSVVFVSNRRGGGTRDDYDLYQVQVDGSAPAVLLLHHTYGIWEGEISRDSQWLVFRSDEVGGNPNIRARRLSGDTALVPVVVDQSLTVQLALSPDGHSLAYTGSATGQREIYVTVFPAATSTKLVSRDGGSEPRWSRTGRELFYKSGNWLMAVDVTPGPTPTYGAPRPLFPVAGYRSARNRPQYDVTPDAHHFVMIKELDTDARGDLVYVENWSKELLAKVKR